eukprot:TRINITY_DN2854_c0_g1_i1.p1 TRINITY_DN2854_c0_g1~~TRINITY_DN2854_c0_g1_i1.p1  ORF type:complete len:167 (+),score=27.30 TRINITY_DN2854_c0_g1_i1:103-603(+)
MTLLDLTKHVTSYIQKNPSPATFLLNSCTEYVRRVLSIFGVTSYSSETVGSLTDQKFRDLAFLAVDFRAKIRQEAKLRGVSQFLQLADKFRESLLKLGIRVQDDKDFTSKVMIVDAPSAILNEKSDNRSTVSGDQVPTMTDRSPSEMFKTDPNYSIFDSEVMSRKF